jgi:hypothetical protein
MRQIDSKAMVLFIVFVIIYRQLDRSASWLFKPPPLYKFILLLQRDNSREIHRKESHTPLTHKLYTHYKSSILDSYTQDSTLTAHG